MDPYCQEIVEAALFLARFLKGTPEQKKVFTETAQEEMAKKFYSHWFPEEPLRGNGYRSIVTWEKFVDPLIIEACRKAKYQSIDGWFPENLVLWVDPNEVSYKIGEYGSVVSVFNKQQPQQTVSSSPPSTPPKQSSPTKQPSPNALQFKQPPTQQAPTSLSHKIDVSNVSQMVTVN